METRANSPYATVSNLIPTWEGSVEGGGGFAPEAAAAVVEQAVHTRQRGERSFRYDLLDERAFAYDDEGLPDPDYDALRRRDIARELLRARLVALAEQREHRSAYEIVFILLAASVAVLLAAPPLVHVLLAAHGTQA